MSSVQSQGHISPSTGLVPLPCDEENNNYQKCRLVAISQIVTEELSVRIPYPWVKHYLFSIDQYLHVATEIHRMYTVIAIRQRENTDGTGLSLLAN